MNITSISPAARQAMLSILIVEDAEPLADLLRRYVESCGHRSAVALSLAEARQALQQGSFDAVIADLDLPDGDGRSLLPDLGPQCSFLSLSGLYQPAVDQNTPAWLAHFPKPFSVEDFTCALDEAARRARAVRQELQGATDGPPASATPEPVPPIIGLILRESARLLTAGEISQEHFEANLARLQAEELTPRDLELSVVNPAPHFQFAITRNGREYARISYDGPADADESQAPG